MTGGRSSVRGRRGRSRDRGEKLSHYKQIPSLRAVLFVSHRQRLVNVVERTATGWSERNFRPGETVSLREPEAAFSVDERWRGHRPRPRLTHFNFA